MVQRDIPRGMCQWKDRLLGYMERSRIMIYTSVGRGDLEVVGK